MINKIYVPLRILGGLGLVLLGLLGFVLPVMPGWPFLLLGLAVLSRHFHWARRLRRHLRRARLQVRRRMKGGRTGPARPMRPTRPAATPPTAPPPATPHSPSPTASSR